MISKNRGQSIIELLIVIALMAIFLPALISGLIASREGKPQLIQREDAYSLIKEAEEATRIIREKDWQEISNNGTFHPELDGATYLLLPGGEQINGFNREITISDVYRDVSGAIAVSGTIDPSSKKITVSVSWNTPYSGSINSELILSRYQNNGTYVDTLESEFEQGIMSGVSVVNDEGGEVILGEEGFLGSWCNPNLTIQAVDLPKSGVANAVSAIEGQVVAGTGNNASGVSFARVDISNPPPPEPPAGIINGTFDGYKTNAVFNEENFAYISTDTNFNEVVILDLTTQDANGKFPEVGYFNAPGNNDSDSVFVYGNIGFTTVDNILYTFDLSAKTGSRDLLGQIILDGRGNEIVVNGNYAYVAVESLNKQLQIIQVSPDGTILTETGYAQFDGLAGQDLFVNTGSTRAYVVTAQSGTQRELFVVDITVKTGSRPTVATYETNGMDPKGIAVVPGNRAIIAGTGGEEYQVFRTTTESVDPPMPRCGGLNIDSGINGLSAVSETDGDNYSYIITGDANAELKIIAGGPGGQFFDTGTFESRIFDAGKNISFNRLEFTADIPIYTTITLQVASALPVTDCLDANYTFVGPDGTINSYFSTEGTIPYITTGNYVNPGRCFKYKAYFSTTDILYSPVLKDVTINYSP